MDIVEVLSRLDDFGIYQKKLLGLFMFAYFLSAFIITSVVLTVAKPMVQCTTLGETIPSVDCMSLNINNQYCGMNKSYWEIPELQRTLTMAAEMEFVCKHEWKIGMVSTIFFFGFLIGNGIFGSLADSIGRKRSFYISISLMCVFQLCSAFASSYMTYLIFHGLVGIGSGGNAVTVTVLLMESVGNHYRSICGIGLCAAFSIGMMCTAILGAYVPDWREFTALIALPYILYLGTCQMILESPHWLLLHKYTVEMEQTMKDIAHINGTSHMIPRVDNNHLIYYPPSHNKPSMSWGQLCSNRLLLRRGLIICFQWFVCGFTYYGLSFNVGNLGTNLYTSMFLSAVAELPAFLPAGFLSDLYGRKLAIVILLWIGAIAHIFCFVLPVSIECEEYGQSCSAKTTRLIVSLIGKSSIASVFAINYTFVVELFPTSVRSIMVGIANQASRIGAMTAAPLVFYLADHSRNLPFIVFAIFTIVAAILIAYLEETRGESLHETIDEELEENEQLLPSQ